MTGPAEPRDVDWPSLLDLAARLGVRVWRLDDTGQLAPVDTVPTTPTAPLIEPSTQKENR